MVGEHGFGCFGFMLFSIVNLNSGFHIHYISSCGIASLHVDTLPFD